MCSVNTVFVTWLRVGVLITFSDSSSLKLNALIQNYENKLYDIVMDRFMPPSSMMGEGGGGIYLSCLWQAGGICP